jgi:hypothetical protein
MAGAAGFEPATYGFGGRTKSLIAKDYFVTHPVFVPLTIK